LYALMMQLKIPEYDENEEEIGESPMWKVFQRVVEDSPYRTGDGNFIWPRMQMPNGDVFGFDKRELAIKKANLTVDGELSSFMAQYYNDPNDASLQRISNENFQYMEPRHLRKDGDSWTYSGKPLRLMAAMDLAFSNLKTKKRDWTAIAIVGMDHEGYLYVLDLERFKTDKMEEYYNKAIELYIKWGFKTLVVETNNGGGLVAGHIKDMVRKEGGSLEVKGKPAPNDSSKFERILQILEPRYRNNEVFHNKIGYIRVLEEELKQPRPRNDDLKDAVALAVSELKPPLGKGIKQAVKSIGERLSRFGARRGPKRRA
jgi:phage terminase large subunit-like protein